MPNPESGEEMTATLGSTARIVMVSPDGTQTDVATLPSILQGGEASGGSRLAMLDGVLYATSGAWLETAPGDRLPLMAAVVAVGEDGSMEEVANTWDIEASENPDGFVLESHPYGLAASEDGLLWVADAGANTVLTVDPESGEVSLVATLDGVPSPLPNAARGDAMEMDPVPTGIVPDGEGGAYVSLLPGFPFLPGSAKVVHVSAEGEVSDYATGLTMITDLRMGPDGELYAVQLGEFTEQGPLPNSGAIWHIHEGEGSEVVFSGLSFPTSIDFDQEGAAYVTINGVGAPGSGEVGVIPGLTEMSVGAPHEEEAGGEMAALPVPEAAMGPAIPQDTGYVVEEIGDGLYWVTDGSYQVIFLTTGEGVIVVDAPPSMGDKILSAIAGVTDEPITHVIYSHHHADHIGGASMYPADATYIAQAETAAILEARGADDAEQDLPFGVLVGGGPVPLPTETFEDSYTLEVGDQVLQLDYHGANHSHGNTFIYAPEQGVLMVVDVVFPGWSPFLNLAVSESVPGYLAAHDQILEYDFDTYVGGHLGRYGTREDVETQKAYIEDIQANALTALQTTDFNAIASETGFENPWLLFGTYLDAAAQACADLTVEEWGGVLGGADLFSKGHCDRIIESMRVD
jgi:glyoxylase-like metal-dependent hydrolase (beta-lactamase superfamily II)/sugar lactone lactonase YvrE